jgi:hypothetical protein
VANHSRETLKQTVRKNRHYYMKACVSFGDWPGGLASAAGFRLLSGNDSNGISHLEKAITKFEKKNRGRKPPAQ